MVREQTSRRRILKEVGATDKLCRSTGGTLPALFTTHLNGDFGLFGGLATRISTGIIGQTVQRVLDEPQTKEKRNRKKQGPVIMQYYWHQYDSNETSVDKHTLVYGSFPTC